MGILNKKIINTLIGAIFLFLLHAWAIKFGWYYLFYEFDMFPHFLGGVVVFMFLDSFFWVLGRDVKFFQKFFLVFLITIIWEFFEIYLDNTFGVEYARNFDSLSDICLGMLGALFATFLTTKNQKNIYNNKTNEE